MPEEGIRMRTGIVVDFRQWEELRKTPGDHVVPLFYSQHIRDGRVHHLPSGKEYDWIADEKPGLVQKNKNYVFCKRFTAKEERRRLQCGIYLAEDFGKYSLIGTQNKINYVDSMDGSDMDLPTTYGVYALLNSELAESINESFREICKHYNVQLIELHDIDKQNGHPSISGMKSICEQLIEAIQ